MDKIIEAMPTHDDLINCCDAFFVRAGRVRVHRYHDCIKFTELENAGKKGKHCISYTVRADYRDPCSILNHAAMRDGGSAGLLEFLRSQNWQLTEWGYGQIQIDGLGECYREQEKGCKVESPFTLEDMKAKPGKPIHFVDGLASAIVIPNQSIKILTNRAGATVDRLFALGDEVETGSYNLVYTGNIVAISAKQIKTLGCPVSPTFTISQFIDRNWDLDLDKINERNANWSD